MWTHKQMLLHITLCTCATVHFQATQSESYLLMAMHVMWHLEVIAGGQIYIRHSLPPVSFKYENRKNRREEKVPTIKDRSQLQKQKKIFVLFLKEAPRTCWQKPGGFAQTTGSQR